MKVHCCHCTKEIIGEPIERNHCSDRCLEDEMRVIVKAWECRQKGKRKITTGFTKWESEEIARYLRRTIKTWNSHPESWLYK